MELAEALFCNSSSRAAAAPWEESPARSPPPLCTQYSTGWELGQCQNFGALPSLPWSDAGLETPYSSEYGVPNVGLLPPAAPESRSIFGFDDVAAASFWTGYGAMEEAEEEANAASPPTAATDEKSGREELAATSPSIAGLGSSLSKLRRSRNVLHGENPSNAIAAPRKKFRSNQRKGEKVRITTRKDAAEKDGDPNGRQDSGSSSSDEDISPAREIHGSRGSAASDQNSKVRDAHGAATDPQSLYARRRRERINERLRTLQKLVPNGTKVDISTMLEEAARYVKFLQLQIKLLSSDELWMYAPLAANGVADVRLSADESTRMTAGTEADSRSAA